VVPVMAAAIGGRSWRVTLLCLSIHQRQQKAETVEMKAVHTIPMLMLVISLSSAAGAQLPFPLPNPSEPDLSKKPQCTKEYTRSIETQITGFEKFRTAGPEFVGQICTLIETGSSWLGGELPDTTRHKLKDMLGFDIDLRFIKAQCRLGQGNLDRELMTHLGFLRSELVRCNDTI
jgi:hypothetical protein